MREEARAWVLRLTDANSGEDRAQFEQWLQEDPGHQAVYDEVLASFHASSVLRTSPIGRRRNLETPFATQRLTLGRGLGVASTAALLLFGVYEVGGGFPGMRPEAMATVMLSSGSQGRSVTLADGSKVKMAAASEVRIELGRARRVAELRKGRIRLSIARDSRPFGILAARSSEQASVGTFDVVIVAGQGTITPVDGSSTAATLPDAGSPKAPGVMSNGARQMVEFDAEPLGRAIERINRLADGPAIELDPSLSGMRVTGVFQQGDRAAIARSLALAFGLKVIGTPSGKLLLTRQK